jgi:orotate phosphoribosyltransferase
MTIPNALLDRLRRTACQRGEFHLPTGQVIEDYFDEYLLAADPALLREVADHMAQHVPAGTDVLVGLELGGIPLAVALSAATGVPAAFLRRERKSHGTRRQVEGHAMAGRNVVLVDDVIRSGSQVLRAASVVRQSDATVSAALCVLDRGLEGRCHLAQHRIDLRSLLTAADLAEPSLESAS